MSNRSLFAQVLRVSCWIADLLLVSFAVYLALRHQDNLTVQTALALGLCVALGGLLPLGVYFVDYLFAESARRSEEARAPETLRETLQRLEHLTRRVEDAAEGATKSTLVARQVPDRIEEKLGVLEEAAMRLRPESLENVAVGIEQLNTRLGTLVKDWEGLKNTLQEASADDSAVLQQLGEQLPAITQALAASPVSDGATPGENEALVARFEAMDRRLADLMGEIKGMGAALHEVVSADAEELRRISDHLPEQLAEKLAEAAKPAESGLDRDAFESLREAIETQGLLRDERLEELIDRLNALEAQWAETEWQTVEEAEDEGEVLEEDADEGGNLKEGEGGEVVSVPVEDPIVEEVALKEEIAEATDSEAKAEIETEPEGETENLGEPEVEDRAEANAAVVPEETYVEPVEETHFDESEADLEDDWVEEPDDSEVTFLEEEAAEAEDDWGESEDEAVDDLPQVEAEALPIEGGEALTDIAEASEPEEIAQPEVELEVEMTDGEGAEDFAEEQPPEAEVVASEAEPSAPPKAKSAKALRAEQEMQLFGGDEFESAPPSPKVAPNHCVVIAKAIIGISNNLFLRGDAPLSWEVGTPLQMTGIGEYQLEVEGLDGPIECEIRLNDELSALGGTIRLEPGQAVKVSPHFAR
jgi:hypothetical protein